MAKTYLELDNHKIKFYGKLNFLKIEFQNRDNKGKSPFSPIIACQILLLNLKGTQRTSGS